MDVSEVLKEAWAAVEEAGLPENLQEVAFREAVRMVVPAQGLAATPAAEGRTPGRSEKSGATSATSGSDVKSGGPNGDVSKIAETEAVILGRVEQHTGVSHEKLEELVHLDDGVLKMSLPGIKMGKNNAEKTRAIAQILTIVRGFGLNEDETSLELVRAEAQRLKCYDSANFSSQVKVLSGYLITGSGANRRIRAKSAGVNGFSEFVDSLLGES